MGNFWPFARRTFSISDSAPCSSWDAVVAGTSSEGKGKTMRELASIDVLTFNMLAPCYKRLSSRNAVGRRHRESYDQKAWLPRAERTFDFFREEVFPCASIIALQEFWMGDEIYKNMFLEEFEKQGFEVLTLQRTGDKVRSIAPPSPTGCSSSSFSSLPDSQLHAPCFSPPGNQIQFRRTPWPSSSRSRSSIFSQGKT